MINIQVFLDVTLWIWKYSFDVSKENLDNLTLKMKELYSIKLRSYSSKDTASHNIRYEFSVN